MKKVKFESEGLTLTGNLYYPDNFEEGKSYPAIVVSGSWTTVKEQMAGTYAKELSSKGFITLAFDFRNFGESEGEPRFYESPDQKKEDIKNAITFLATLPEVDKNAIGLFGVCAGAMYTVTSYLTCSMKVPAAANNKVPAKVLISQINMHHCKTWLCLFGNLS